MTMVEQIAKAMYLHASAQRNIVNPPYEEWIALNPNGQGYWEGFARSALRAAREIPDSTYNVYRCDKLWRDLDSRKVWNLWIDAALAEKPE